MFNLSLVSLELLGCLDYLFKIFPYMLFVGMEVTYYNPHRCFTVELARTRKALFGIDDPLVEFSGQLIGRVAILVQDKTIQDSILLCVQL
jgi:hypothetical protein